MKTAHRKGFTIVELLIVVGIIGLLAALIIPNFATIQVITRTNTCLSNIDTLYGALELAAIETGADITNLADDDAISAIIFPNYLRAMPDCQDGTYSTDENGFVHCDVHSP